MLLNSVKIAVGNDGDYKIRVYDIYSGGLIFEMSGHTDLVESMIQFNARYMITGSYDKTLKLWSVNDGSLLKTLHTFSAQICSGWWLI